MIRSVTAMRERTFDVVVIAATPAGCAAALTAARSGSMTLLVEPTPVVGGMNANGVHAFDTATMQALGRLSEEFAQGVRAHYAELGLKDELLHSESDLYWESKVAAKVWRQMLDAEPNITLATGTVPLEVRISGRRIQSIVVTSASDTFGNPSQSGLMRSVMGRVFVDATYEGDIAAWAGASFRLGREARSDDEPHAGVIYSTYLDRVPFEGWLPQTILPGSTGEADESVMAFNCRLSCRLYASKGDQNERRVVAPPADYDSRRYNWRRHDFLPDGAPRFGTGVIPSVNGKFLLNVMNMGNDLVTGAREYILAGPFERGQFRQKIIDHALGFLYYIQTEGGTPEVCLAHDEYEENSFIPYQIYVREGRRVIGDYLLNEANINPHLRGDGFRPPLLADAIAIGDWPIESKKCADLPTLGKKWPEGLIHARGVRAPYQIPFGAIVPSDLDNVLVTCALSATHVAFSAIRVESVWTQTGMAAGCAAHLSCGKSSSVREVPIALLQDELMARGARLTYFADVPTTHPQFRAIQWLALRGEVPWDRHWRFFPSRSITWGEFIAMTIRALEVPTSVTGAHFEGLEPGAPFFRELESLYDLGSRAGVEIFPGMLHYREDQGTDHTRAEVRTRWLMWRTDETVMLSKANAFLRNVLAALNRDHEIAPYDPSIADVALTRADAAGLTVGLVVAATYALIEKRMQ